MSSGLALPPFRKVGPSLTPLRGSTVPPAPAAPAVPNTPSPSDAGTAYYTLLSWVSAGATKFDILLSTINPPPAVTVPKYVGTSYVPTLAPATTYYWQIVAFNDGGSATGPVWSFTTPAATAVLFSLAGVIVTSRARFGSLSIRDVLNAAPNTASLLFDTVAPIVGQAVKIGLGTLDPSALLFGGEIQSVDQSYVDTTLATVWPVNIIDQTFAINKRRPFGTWVNVSATTIAQYCVTTFAPGFTSTSVQAGLPAVTINFDGSADFMSCMGTLAQAASTSSAPVYTYVDYAKGLHLYKTEISAAPTALSLTNPPLNDPSPITFSTDLSQIRTRVYGKGHSEIVSADLAVGETIIPVASAANFTLNGGSAIVGSISGGAQTQPITYSGVQLGGGAGSVVGSGVTIQAATFNTAATFDTGGSSQSSDTASPVFTSSTYLFTSSDVGASIYIKSGTNAIVGFYPIVSVSVDGLATLQGPCGTASTLTTLTWGCDYSRQTSPRITFAATLSISVSNQTTHLLDPTDITGAAVPPTWLGNSINITSGTGFIVQQVTVTGRTGTHAICSNSLGTASSSGGSGYMGTAVSTVTAGTSTLLVASTTPFSASGGWVTVAGQLVRYTGISGSTLIGLSATALLSSVAYGTAVIPAPTLIGVNSNNGLSAAVAKGSTVAIWVQRDDMSAQSALGLLELDENGVATDGIREYTIANGSMNEPALTALCDADLALFSRPIVSASYYTRDKNSTSGKTVAMNLGWGLSGSFVIQDVTITFDGPALNPRYQVKASSVSFTLGDLLRRVVVI